MSWERLVWGAVILILLYGGVLVGRGLAPVEAGHVEAIRTWLWQTRSLDLVVQACLVFVGALGAAALLPDERDGDELGPQEDEWHGVR